MSDRPALPDMKAVKSSNIEALGHDAARGEIFVRFKGGKTYCYLGVNSATFEKLRQAESIGGHFHQHIKAHFAGTPL